MVGIKKIMTLFDFKKFLNKERMKEVILFTVKTEDTKNRKNSTKEKFVSLQKKSVLFTYFCSQYY